MHMRWLRSLLGGKSGRKNTSPDLQNLTAVSVSCGDASRSDSYAFAIRKAEDKWLLDAEYFPRDTEHEVSVKGAELTEGEISGLFAILEQADCIAFAESRQKKKQSPIAASDAPTYLFCLTFENGVQYTAPARQTPTEQYCYHIAENHHERSN